MRRLSVWIVSLLVVAIVTGCGGAHRYDQRLIAADSLMLSAPDSALALLTPICGDSLPTDGDRAYHALLLTQARYKCHITANDDSAITLALDYYHTHSGEQDKLTNAYIYKGAVMEELGHPDSAMLYYKTAEEVAAPDDYFNLGYVKTRMGALYRDHYAIDGREIMKYEEALACFERAGNRQRQLMCLMNLGSLYRLKTPEKSVQMLQDAMTLALQLQDSVRYMRSQQFLVMTYYAQKDYQQAHRLIQDILEHSADHHRLEVEFLADAAAVYAKLGMPDSAQSLISTISNQPLNDVIEQMSYLESLGEIALARGDTVTYRSMTDKYTRMNDSLLTLDASIKIMQTEDNIGTIYQQQVKKKHALTTRGLTLVIILFITLLAVVTFLYYRRKHRYDQIIADFKQQSASQLNDLSVLKQNVDKLQIQDDQLKSFISNHLNMTSEMIEACYHEPKSKLSHQVKRIVEFQHDNERKWIQLFHYIDAEYNQIISKTRKAYPQLHDRDLLLIALTCMRFSQIQIAIILGYANATSISTVKFRLAQKMGLDCPLNDYINRIISASDTSM